MIRLLQSSWVTALIGGALYMVVTIGLLVPAQFENAKAALTAAARPDQSEAPSWQFSNPEFDQWIAEVRQEKEALALREQQLKELQTRLDAERLELTTVTQTVHQLQSRFDRNVLRINDQEAENVKRQAKVLSGMNPEAAATLVNEMPEDVAVQILFTMRPEEASAVLEALSKLGKTEARRAASMTERMRRALPPDPAARPNNSP